MSRLYQTITLPSQGRSSVVYRITDSHDFLKWQSGIILKNWFAILKWSLILDIFPTATGTDMKTASKGFSKAQRIRVKVLLPLLSDSLLWSVFFLTEKSSGKTDLALIDQVEHIIEEYIIVISSVV